MKGDKAAPDGNARATAASRLALRNAACSHNADTEQDDTHPVQRCRNHKIRNIVERLPEEQKDQVKAAMRAS